MRYIDSTVIIRQINSDYLSVGIRIPEKVLNGTINQPDSSPLRQLCVNSCPDSERVNIAQLLANISTGSSVQKKAYAAAEQTCREKSVTDFFYDSCVFDLLMTGEALFADMANSAFEDVRKFASRQPRWSNRTHLVEYYTKSLPDKQPSPTGSHISSAAVYRLNSSLVRTLLFVYIMHVLSILL